MLWKVLSALTALVLAGALYFAYTNQGQIREEMEMKRRGEENLQKLKAAREEAGKQTVVKTKALEDATKERDAARDENTKAQSDIKQKETELAKLKTDLEEANKQFASINEQIEKAGDSKKLTAEVTELTGKVKESEGAIANWQQQQALTEEQITKESVQLTHLREIDARQRRGQLEPEFSARVVEAHPEYGFFVINKGNSGGAYANALVNVKRGKNVVAKLKLRNVEPSQSTADLVPGSLTADEGVRPGDLVVAAPAPPPPPAEPAPAPAAAPGATAPAAPANGAAAPIMNGDPFGAGAPAAPATAPAGADPFGAPPAPTVAPAPEAGAAAKGTPEKPSTADPFAK